MTPALNRYIALCCPDFPSRLRRNDGPAGSWGEGNLDNLDIKYFIMGDAKSRINISHSFAMLQFSKTPG
jgi:hypothetical protein